MASAKISDLIWPLKGQDGKLKVGCGHLLTLITHIISISVNGSKLRGWKHDFLEKSVGGCISYDAIALCAHPTRSIFFCRKLRKECPISYGKFQRDPLSGSAAISEKLIKFNIYVWVRLCLYYEFSPTDRYQIEGDTTWTPNLKRPCVGISELNDNLLTPLGRT